MRTGADTADASKAPEGFDIYLGYVDGNYVSYYALRDRFPGKLVVPIATQQSGNVGTVFDGPPDNGSWSGVVGWVVRARRRGVDPTVYTDGSDWATGVQAFNSAEVPQPHWWIADWNGVADIPSGAIGHQYRNFGNDYDANVFADYWPGVDPAPVAGGGPHPPAPPPKPPTPPPPPPLLTTEEDMLIVYDGSGGIWILSGALLAPIATPGDVTNLAAAGVKEWHATPGTFTNLKTAAAAMSGHLTGTLAISGNLQAQ